MQQEKKSKVGVQFENCKSELSSSADPLQHKQSSWCKHTDKYSQVHKRHECGDVKHTLKQKVYCLCLHSLKIPVAVETPQHTVPICTTGSQQPNSRWPSPVTTAPGQTRREIAVFARHPDNTRTLRLKPKPHSAQRGKRGPWSFVWVLTWMRTQSKGESCSRGQRGLCGDPHPLWRNTRRKQPQQNIYFLCYLAQTWDHCQLSDTTWAFLSILTSTDKDRKHCPALHNRPGCVGWLHLHRAAYCSGVYNVCPL